MQTILVPCDFSEAAMQGLQFAVELAEATGGSVVVLSIIKPSEEEEEHIASERFREAFERMRITGRQEVRIRQEIRCGKLVPTIIGMVTEREVDLIVIGTRGARGWEGTFMGSNVEKIVRTSPVPVFSIKCETHLKELKNIVFPCDMVMSDHYGLSQVKNLQAALGARIHLVRVDTTGFMDRPFFTDRLHDYARFHHLSKYTVHVVTEHDEKDGILRFAREIGADMIAMTTRGTADLNHFYRSSIAADVVNHAHILTWTCIQQPVRQLQQQNRPGY